MLDGVVFLSLCAPPKGATIVQQSHHFLRVQYARIRTIRFLAIDDDDDDEGHWLQVTICACLYHPTFGCCVLLQILPHHVIARDFPSARQIPGLGKGKGGHSMRKHDAVAKVRQLHAESEPFSTQHPGFWEDDGEREEHAYAIDWKPTIIRSLMSHVTGRLHVSIPRTLLRYRM